MKTIHRIMHDVLTPEEYKKFCYYVKPKTVTRFYRTMTCFKPSYVLDRSFSWGLTHEEYDYWNDIYVRLVELERKA